MPSSRVLAEPSDDHAAAERDLAAWPPALVALTRLVRTAPGALPPLDDDGWNAFCRLTIDRHRVAPAVLDGARRAGVALPERVACVLQAEARKDAAAALGQKAESFRLVSALQRTGCRPAILKGWPLAEELYGSAGARHSKDIDLYIGPDEIDRAIEGLIELGYSVDPVHARRMPLAGRSAFRAEYNDIAFIHPGAGTQVELHWRNYHFRGWPELRDIPDAFVECSLDRTGVGVPVLSPAANLIYLSMHGQRHLWLRLKWLLDIAKLVEARGADGLRRDLEVAREVGAARTVVLTVRLAHLVFGSPLPEGWPRPGRAGRRALARFCRLIASETAEPGALEAKLQNYRTAFGLAETLPQRIGVLRYLLWRRFRFGVLRGRTAPT